MRSWSRTTCACLLLLWAHASFAQSARRPLTHKDYDSWRSIQAPALSRDGRYVAYGLFPQEGDGQLVVREISTGKEYREGVGQLPPPPITMTDERNEPQARQRTIGLIFTRSGRYLVATTFPTRADLDKAKKEKKPDEMPKDGLLVIDLASGAAVRKTGVKSMQVPEKGGDWVAWLKTAKPAEKPKPGDKPNPEEKPAPGAKKEYGTELVLMELGKPEPNERVFADVLEYSLSKDGAQLVYTVSSKQEDANGLYVAGVGTAAAPAALLKGKGKYSKLTWDRMQTQLALLSDRDDAAAKQPRQKLYYWDRKAAAAAEIVSTGTPGFQAGYVIGDGGLSFARDGSSIFLGCAPAPPPEKDKDAAATEEKAVADLWHWKDDIIQPMQKVQAGRERNRVYTAVYHIADKKFLQLADPALRTVTPSDDGRYALGSDDRAYRRMADYDGRYADHYLVNTTTGGRTRVVEKLDGGAPSWSPDGKYAVFFRDRHWHTLSVPEGRLTTITAGLGISFYNEEEDRPQAAGPYGAAGWTNDGRSVLLYDRFDLWQIAPDGGAARNVTDGWGRREQMQLRVVRLESEEDEPRRGIDPAKQLLLRAESLETRDTGFWRDRLNADAPPQKLIMAAKAFRPIAKAKDADVILLTASTFYDFPDLAVTDSAFRDLRKQTDANPQKAQFIWGKGDLVRFRNADGVPLKAALFKPENFDPAKKYPLMVYIYERLSQTVHSFIDPRPGTGMNAAYYVSNGYLVLMPDIVYTVGAPGQSAQKCVLPAVQAVVDRGYVDEKAIGISGHSWGGYQIAYLVGHTTLFRAAEAGAPVGNMISAYNGIRWGSGMPRQFQYEKAQSRIGGSIWENPVQYIENSPIFSADRVETPVLILHDDLDDAVPWYQGIELFLSLRRLGKEAYLFNYNGEYHGLRRRQNQKDFTVRMQQFFDHFLKGAPPPEWMQKGVPYIDRETEKEKFKAAAYGR